MAVLLGKWNLNRTPVTQSELEELASCVSEFGPDERNICIAGNVGFLFAAFHTTCESRLSVQPHKSGSRKIIMWDGRLDNRDDLARDLYRRIQPDLSDVEIAAEAFEHWGVDAFHRFLGDWSFSIWDPAPLELVLARDFIGVKKLFYIQHNNSIVWSNFLDPLVCYAAPLEICDEYIAGLFGTYPATHLTPYKQIASVSAAGFVQCSNGKFNKQQYWQFRPHAGIKYKDDREYEDHYRHLLDQAVACRLRSDKPILSELSGGLDSSAIVVCADNLHVKNIVSGPPIDTVSYFDPDEPDEDDVAYFTAVEGKRGYIGHHLRLQTRGDSIPLSRNGLRATPVFEGRQEILTGIDQLVHQRGYRVVLSGIGGDEANGMALDFRVQVADFLVRLKIGRASRLLFDWSLRTGYPWIQLLGQSWNVVLPSKLRFRTNQQLTQTAPWIKARFAEQHNIAHGVLTAADGKASWLPSSRDACSTIVGLQRQLSHTSTRLFEKRYPFLDQRLLGYLLSIPTDQVLRPGQTRYLMRRSLSHLLPREVLERKSKSSAGRCVSQTIAKHWSEIVSLLQSPLTCSFGYFERSPLLSCLHSLKHGHGFETALQAFRALSLELWLRNAAGKNLLRAKTDGQEAEKYRGLYVKAQPADERS